MVEEAPPMTTDYWLDMKNWEEVPHNKRITFVTTFYHATDQVDPTYHESMRFDGGIAASSSDIVASAAHGVRGTTTHTLDTHATHVIVVRTTDTGRDQPWKKTIVAVKYRRGLSTAQLTEIRRRIANELS